MVECALTHNARETRLSCKMEHARSAQTLWEHQVTERDVSKTNATSDRSSLIQVPVLIAQETNPEHLMVLANHSNTKRHQVTAWERLTEAMTLTSEFKPLIHAVSVTKDVNRCVPNQPVALHSWSTKEITIATSITRIQRQSITVTPVTLTGHAICRTGTESLFSHEIKLL